MKKYQGSQEIVSSISSFFSYKLPEFQLTRYKIFNFSD